MSSEEWEICHRPSWNNARLVRRRRGVPASGTPLPEAHSFAQHPGGELSMPGIATHTADHGSKIGTSSSKKRTSRFAAQLLSAPGGLSSSIVPIVALARRLVASVFLIPCLKIRMTDAGGEHVMIRRRRRSFARRCYFTTRRLSTAP